MSFSCALHGWQHLWNQCPACIPPVLTFNNSFTPTRSNKHLGSSFHDDSAKYTEELASKLAQAEKALEFYANIKTRLGFLEGAKLEAEFAAELDTGPAKTALKKIRAGRG